jgi:hypothetical protein
MRNRPRDIRTNGAVGYSGVISTARPVWPVAGKAPGKALPGIFTRLGDGQAVYGRVR